MDVSARVAVVKPRVGPASRSGGDQTPSGVGSTTCAYLSCVLSPGNAVVRVDFVPVVSPDFVAQVLIACAMDPSVLRYSYDGAAVGVSMVRLGRTARGLRVARQTADACSTEGGGAGFQGPYPRAAAALTAQGHENHLPHSRRP